MKLKLYFSPGACSLASHIALHEVKADFTLEKVSLATHQMASGSFYSINPNGAVPTIDILDNGERLTQNVAVLSFLADHFPQAHLLPPVGTMKRSHAMEMLAFLNSDVHHLFHPLFNPHAPVGEKAQAIEDLQKKFSTIDEALRRNTYVTGPDVSVVDFYLFVMERWLTHFKHPSSQLSSIQRHMKLMNERPSVQQALKMELH